MHAVFNFMCRSTAGNNAQLRAVLNNNNIVYMLQLLVVADAHTSLQRRGNFFARLYADKITLLFFKGGSCSIFISIGLHSLPPVFFHQLRIFFGSFAGAHQFQRSLFFYFNFHSIVIKLHKRSAAAFFFRRAGFNANVLQAPPRCFRKVIHAFKAALIAVAVRA